MRKYESRVYELCGSKAVNNIVMDIIRQFDLMPPDGMKIHKVAPARASMKGIERYYLENSSHQGETLDELMKRDMKLFENITWKLNYCLSAGAKI